MKKVTFCFGTHNHQPIGNFDYVIEEAYEKSYLPFFKLAAKYNIKFATHFSGILLEWLVKNHPEQITLIKKMIASGQLEIISGGYYEPILAVIPDRDKHAQITKLTSYIKEHLGCEASGLWLAERVWEQQLVAPLVDANVRYVIVDDTHFRAAGLEEKDLTGYYLTEDLGKTVGVFPISKALRYTIPFQPVDETIRVLRDAASENENRIVTFADDGEKFGVWPRTFDHVYKRGWLKEFFAKLEENSSWLTTAHFGEVIKHVRPKGSIYLPNASYAEMMQWALPAAEANLLYEEFTKSLSDDPRVWSRYQQFVRGGFWRNFFVKYPESNHLHKRMLDVSQRVSRHTDAGSAYDHLLAAQCNDTYWHGVFGGIYLPNLRHEVYANLLATERELDEIETKSEITLKHIDLNTDGIDDIIIESDLYTLALDPARGGAITEWSYKPKTFNLTNFINRIPEAYHEKVKNASALQEVSGSRSIHDAVITKEKGLEKYLIYDWYKHGSLIEHFFSPSATVEDLEQMTILEYGDFFRSLIEPTISDNGKEITLTFTHDGSVAAHSKSNPLRLTKSLTCTYGSSELKVEYELENIGAETLPIRFGSEWTFGLLGGDTDDRYYESPGVKLSKKNKQLRSTGEIENATQLSLVEEWTGFRIDIETDTPCTFWRAPIETVASSESGFERVYQGSIVIPVWKFTLKPDEKMSIFLSVRVGNLAR
jgi:alpha-amylase